MKITKLLAAALISMAAFSACTMGDNGVNPDKLTGEATYATFNFVVDGDGTRAEASPTDVGEKTEVKDIRLLIFKTGASTVCEVNDLYATGDTGWDASKSSTVLLTSGEKRIFVIANTANQSRINTALAGITPGTTTLASFYAMIHELGGTSVASYSIAEITDLTRGYVLSNPADKNALKSLVAGVTATDSRNATAGDETKNNFKFKVDRAAAKAYVYYKDNAALETSDGVGMLQSTTIKYGFRNVNRSLHLFQQFATDNVDAYDIAGRPLPRAPYFTYFEDNYTEDQMKNLAVFSPYYFSDYLLDQSMKTKAQVDATTPASVYLTENTSVMPRRGNSTYAAIEAFFMPKANQVIVGTSLGFDDVNKKFTNIERNATDASSPVTLYMLTDNGGIENMLPGALFFDLELAKKAAYAVQNKTLTGYTTAYDPGTLIETFTGGKCYYRLNIGRTLGVDDTEWGLRRNYLYKAQITKFGSIGASDISKLDENPEQPLGQKTHVTAVIEVQAWTEVDFSGEV